MAVSRLDRLFILLDTGTTPVTRKAAAQQLGEVVKLHPHELNNLLAKVLVHLRSTNWDSRIAAGQAVEAIVKNIPEWNPTPQPKQERGCENQAEDAATSDRLRFDKFDICRLLKHGASLLGSAGAEFEVQDDTSGEVDPKERIARQRKLLQKKLGLDMGDAIGMNTEDLFNDEDLDYTPASSVLVQKQPTLQAAELIDSEFRAGMSSRQKNKAKRMAKLFAKQRSKDAVETNEKSNDSTDGEPEEKRRKIGNVIISQPATDSKLLVDNVPEESNEWPLESFCEEVCNDLFDPSWEIRHGAGVGLREVLKAHGESGGKMGDSTVEEMIQQHQDWLEDLAIRLLCVFALDRFGDFVSDEVVAPVRETCAQTLGVVLKHMNESGVHKTVAILLKLLTQEQWEVRHGGLLGIKYALAVRQVTIKVSSNFCCFAPVSNGMTVVCFKLCIVLCRFFYFFKIKVTTVFNEATSSPNLNPQVLQQLDSKRQQVQMTVTETNLEWQTLQLRVHTFTACAVVNLEQLPEKINPVIKPLMEAVKKEENTLVQNYSALCIAKLLQQCIARSPCPNSKIIKNLCTSLCVDPHLTPLASCPAQPQSSHENSKVCLFFPQLIQHLPYLCMCLQHPSTAVRHMAARCVGVMSKIATVETIHIFLEKVLPWLGAIDDSTKQEGAIEALGGILAKFFLWSASEKSGGKLRPSQPQTKEVVQEYIAGAESVTEDPATRDFVVMRARMMAAKLLGGLCCCICDPSVNAASQEIKPAESLAQLLLFHLNSKSALQRFSVALVICEWAALQKVQLYEDFAKSRAKCDVDETVSSASLSEETEKPKLKATGHVFQALQYLRKLCNHPALVLTAHHPEHKRITEKLAAENSSLRDIQHAPKLSALKQLLLDCGLGNGGSSESGTETIVAQHRILIFCQLKSMLDIVEHDLLKPHLPSVTYLRLDGSIPAGQRHSIVSRFSCCCHTENIGTDFNTCFLFFLHVVPPNLFKDGKTEKSDGATSGSGKTTMKSVLENLGELWDQEQYDSEYSLEKFMHSLK
ncbi:PREDICTED: TATA-binding protein-associated factor 172 [Thamnophis sirtalis]|uniref:TATA-binding protein-associated factor 172 n=1 Tax=Thamnophis sirtalis TaxID=35019 RepID=A0A6I9X632_9SAUR|nr:PREDICTED: TATA-binding protein-associated factor 172 [Thamnophis sirtalis]